MFRFFLLAWSKIFFVALRYPSISASILSFFMCRSVSGVSYLVADFRLQCFSAEWNQYLPLAVVAVILYPSTYTP